MVSIVTGTASIGVLYGIVNLLLIPFLSGKFGSSEIPGQLVSIGMLSTIFVGPAIGILSDKLKKRTPFILAISIIASLGIFGLMAQSKILSAIAAVIVVSCAFSYLTPYGALISDYTSDDKKDSNFGFVMGVVNITTFLASILINFTYEINSSLTFFILAIFVIIAIVPMLIYTKKNPATITKTSKNSESNLNLILFLKNNPILIICLFMQFGFWFSFGGLLPYLTSFLSSTSSMNLGTASTWVGASTLISGIFAFLTGYLSNKLGQRKLFTVSIIAITVLALFITIAFNFVMEDSVFSIFWIIAFFSFSIFAGFLYSLTTSILSSTVSRDEQGRAFGINNIVMIVSESISVSLIGFLIPLTGYRGMFTAVLAGFVITLVSSVILFEKRRT
jgi:MFS family permease